MGQSKSDQEELQQTLASTKEELGDHKQRLANGSSTQKEQVEELESRLKAKSSHADSLEAELSKTKSAASKSASEVEALQTRVIELSKELEEAQTSLASSQAEKTTLQIDLDSLRTEHDALLKSSSSLQTKLNDLTTAHGTLKSSTSSQATSLTELQSSLSTTQTQLKDAEAASATATSRRDALQRDNEELMADLTELREKLVRLTDDLAEKGEKLDTATRGIREKDGEADKMRAELESSRNGSKSLETKFREGETLVGELRKKVERAEREVEYAQDDAKTRESEIQSLRNKLAQADSEASKIRSEGQASAEELKTVRTSLEEAQRSIDEEQEKRQASDKELVEIKELVEQQRSELEDMRTRQAEQADATEKAPEFSPIHAQELISPLTAAPPASIAGSATTADAEQMKNKLEESEKEVAKSQIQLGEMQKQIDSLNALILIERDKAMKAMAEVFGMGSAPIPAPSVYRNATAMSVSQSTSILAPPVSTSPIPVVTKPAVQPAPRRPSSFVHRRSSSHLPTLNENMQLNQRDDVDFLSPKTTLLPLPSPHSPIKTPSPKAERTAFLQQQRGPLPSATRHARRQSLTMLKSRMEEELGLPDILQPGPDHFPGMGLPSQLDSLSQRRPSAKLGHDMIWYVQTYSSSHFLTSGNAGVPIVRVICWSYKRKRFM